MKDKIQFTTCITTYARKLDIAVEKTDKMLEEINQINLKFITERRNN